MRRVLNRTREGAYIGRGFFVQSDWDFPGLARDFGWSLRRVQRRNGRTETFARAVRGCAHTHTDGTVNCACGVTASDFIRAAGDYLDRIATY